MKKPNTIDPGRVFDGYLFETNRDRALYIGKSVKDRPQWLRDNPDVWIPVREVQQEASSDPGLPESASHVAAQAVGPNSQMAPQKVQNNAKQGGAGSLPVASGDTPSLPQLERASAVPMADTASSAPPDKDEIVIGGRRYVSTKRLASMLGISLTTLSRRCTAGKAPPKIKISGDYFELPEG